VSLDEAMAASQASRSQLYRYFADNDARAREAIGFQTRRIT